VRTCVCVCVCIYPSVSTRVCDLEPVILQRITRNTPLNNSCQMNSPSFSAPSVQACLAVFLVAELRPRRG